jgi:hypothetical protein
VELEKVYTHRVQHKYTKFKGVIRNSQDDFCDLKIAFVDWDDFATLEHIDALLLIETIEEYD